MRTMYSCERHKGSALLFTSICLAALAFSAAAQDKDKKEDLPQPDRTVIYKSVGGMDLELHVFDPLSDASAVKRPAIVFFFGGGWKGGSPKQFYPQCHYLASHGMLAMAAEYRTLKNGGVPPKECVKDGKSAIRFVRSHAEELRVDPNRIAAGGGSAGGHIAAATGTVNGFEHEDADLTISSRPNALVLFNPVYDNSSEGYGYDRVQDYWESFSPLHNIDEDTPPCVVFLGTEDKLIPIATAQEFQSRMKALGIRSDLHTYEGEGHGFFNWQRKEHLYFKKTMTEAHHFLQELDYLKDPPNVEGYVEKYGS